MSRQGDLIEDSVGNLKFRLLPNSPHQATWPLADR